eukprot:6172343-Pleurochrysis_carterae.AAC.3
MRSPLDPFTLKRGQFLLAAESTTRSSVWGLGSYGGWIHAGAQASSHVTSSYALEAFLRYVVASDS